MSDNHTPLLGSGKTSLTPAGGYNFDVFRGPGTGPTSLEPSRAAAPESAPTVRLFLRRKGFLALCCTLGALCGLLLTLNRIPLYEAHTTIEIRSADENPLHLRETGYGAAGSTSSAEYDLQTKIKILQSHSLLERVVSKLHAEDALMAEARRSTVLRRWLDKGNPPTLTPEQALAIAVSQAARNLKIHGEVNTRVVEISFQASERELAANFANTLASEFIQDDLESRWQTTQHTESFFKNQLAEVKAQLEQSEQQLQSYGNVVGLLFNSQKEDVAEDRLRQLQQELMKAQADRVAKQSSYLMTSGASPDSLPAVLDDPTLKEYKVKLTDLRRELAELDTTLTPSNPKVKKVQSQISALESALESARTNIVRRLQNEYVAAQGREQMLQSEYVGQSRLVGSQAARIARYNIIKRDVDTNRALYDSMLQRVKETGIVSALRASSIRVIDPAQPSPFAAGNSFSTNAVLGFLAGGLVGAAFLVLRQRLNRTIQEPGDAISCLNAVELGAIPRGIGGRSFPLLTTAAVDQAQRRDMALTMHHRTVSPMAESFRAILISLLYTNDHGKPLKVIVVSSANPSEGKTTVTTNLAIALARVNKRVLLVDGDLRVPRIHEIFGLSNGSGLSDALLEMDGEAPGLCLRETAVPNLSVLTRGGASGDDLVYSKRLPQIIERLRGQFDAILIDTPPILYAPDARVFGHYADAVIMVIRARHTTRDAAQLAVDRFRQDGIQLFGTILNDWNPSKSTAYGYEAYGSKQYRRYIHAGEEDAAPDHGPLPKSLPSILKI